MKGSFLSRGDEMLNRIAQHLPQKGNINYNSGRRKNFAFKHLSPSISKTEDNDSEKEADDTPAKEQNVTDSFLIIFRTTCHLQRLIIFICRFVRGKCLQANQVRRPGVQKN